MLNKYLILSSFMMVTISLEATADTLVTTIGKYAKPGASVNMSYKAKRVALNEIADLNVVFSTMASTGTLALEVKLDNALKAEETIKSKYLFSLDANQTEHKLNLKVSSSQDGRHYIRILAKLNAGEGQRLRSFAIPISVGSGQVKFSKQKPVLKNSNGENISVYKAEEVMIQK